MGDVCPDNSGKAVMRIKHHQDRYADGARTNRRQCHKRSERHAENNCCSSPPPRPKRNGRAAHEALNSLTKTYAHRCEH
ncbi:hypothetical protein GALL_548350 [mine drainage metagenome]|uniref:Uncharacterized protein n=1 Tax=mine drainage metagenome TaxID=410659 RepID=A0A1J5NZE8_9ZZZZ